MHLTFGTCLRCDGWRRTRSECCINANLCLGRPSALISSRLGPKRPQNGCAILMRSHPRRSQTRELYCFRGGRSGARLHVSAVFTGIVQGQGTVRKVDRKGDFSSIQIQFPGEAMKGIAQGASVAINGTCLTVTGISLAAPPASGQEAVVLNFDIIVETLRATNLGNLDQGSSVNFERAAKVGDEIGGHNVSGHVHTTAKISEVQETENNRRIVFEVPDHWMQYILPKGFIAVDGASLTVGEVGPNWFSVYLIPETLRVTVLGFKGVGDSVNVEIDAQTQAIVDTVEKVVGRYMKIGKLAAVS